MAKQISVGVGGVKRVAEAYTSVDGYVRRIRRGVGGVDGAVREFFTGELVLYEQGTVHVPFYFGSSVFNSNHLCYNASCIDTESNGYTGSCVIKTVNNLDVTGYNTINVEVKRTASGLSGYVFPYVEVSKVGSSTTKQTKKLDTSITVNSGKQTLSFKFNAFSGSGILQFELGLTSSSFDSTQKFGGQYYKIWLSTT